MKESRFSNPYQISMTSTNDQCMWEMPKSKIKKLHNAWILRHTIVNFQPYVSWSSFAWMLNNITVSQIYTNGLTNLTVLRNIIQSLYQFFFISTLEFHRFNISFKLILIHQSNGDPNNASSGQYKNYHMVTNISIP